jgi:hypothetical protein
MLISTAGGWGVRGIVRERGRERREGDEVALFLGTLTVITTKIENHIWVPARLGYQIERCGSE